MMNMVVLNNRKYTAQVAHDAGLSAVMDITTADDMRTDQSWDQEATLYKWYTEQDGDTTVIYANFQGADPNQEDQSPLT